VEAFEYRGRVIYSTALDAPMLVAGCRLGRGGNSAMTVPALVDGLLPFGRHHVTLDDVRAAFVDDPAFGTSRSRSVIWEHFERANELLQTVVTVHAAWIGGSYTTDKVNPRDIDVVHVVDADDRVARSDPERRIVESFDRRVVDPLTGHLVPEHGLLVDSFVVDWAPHLPPVTTNLEYQRYAGTRGYWDDWWMRRRSGSKKDPPKRGDAIPARGYLEVQFSAYA